ncbi:MAG: glycine cleavage system protein GcvH [Bacteroidales bacterium]|nr:glycine cleavage system protein GcvH [Bacteroidales bacterium]
MNIPENLYYTKEHEWLALNGDEGTVGVTDFAQHQLGDVVFIEVNTIGEAVATGEAFGTIEAVKTVSDMFAPVACEILEYNENLSDNPELINKDPYGEGWIVKVKIQDVNEIKELLSAADYQKLVEA